MNSIFTEQNLNFSKRLFLRYLQKKIFFHVKLKVSIQIGIFFLNSIISVQQAIESNQSRIKHQQARNREQKPLWVRKAEP